MPDNANIRLYRATDAASVTELIQKLQRHERQFEPRMTAPDAIQDWYLDHLLSRCAKEDGVILVAAADDRIVGFIAVLARVASTDIDEDGYDYAYVSDVAVRQDHRGQGIGAALLSAAEAHAREQGACWLRVDVLAANEGAASLYRRTGFINRAIQLEKKLHEKD